MSVILEAKDVSKTFRRGRELTHALTSFSLTAEAGEILCLLGPDGSGKTTFLRLLTGLLQPDSGTIRVLGYDTVADAEKVQSSIGYMPQKFGLYEDLTVMENMRLCAEMRAVPAEIRSERFRTLLEMTDLTKFTERLAGRLSGGMKQKLALACTLVSDPKLILLDEPFSALDTYLKWQLEQEMYKHLKEAGKTVIFVSHNRDEVYRLCDTVSCMNRGKMEVMEPLKEFFQNPKTRTAAILSGCKNISAAERVDAHTLRAMDWGVTLHVKEREIADDIRAVGIRAHFLSTVERPGEENVFPVNESEIWEDPFEWNISFRKNAECSWLQWKIAKTDWSPEMGIPKELYLKEEDILLLTDS